MKQYLIRKRITAIALLIVLFGFGLAQLDKNQKYIFIEGYGLLQQLFGKQQINDFEVVKGKDGVLYNTYFATDVSGELQQVTDTIQKINKAAEASKADFLVVAPPDKFLTELSDYENGYPYNLCNENMDYYINRLTEMGILTLDLREELVQYASDITDVFYRTDHHWTTAAGFMAFSSLLNFMEDNFPVTYSNKDMMGNIDFYYQYTFSKVFLGSQGRKTGVLYSGLDDFTVIYPKFNTELSFRIDEYDYAVYGKFEDTLINSSVFLQNASIYEKDWYGMYTKSVSYGFGSIINHREPDMPKILLIRDSFSSVTASFLSLVSSQVDLLYPYLFEGNIDEVIQKGNYDYVIVMVYPGNYTENFFDLNFSK